MQTNDNSNQPKLAWKQRQRNYRWEDTEIHTQAKKVPDDDFADEFHRQKKQSFETEIDLSILVLVLNVLILNELADFVLVQIVFTVYKTRTKKSNIRSLPQA